MMRPLHAIFAFALNAILFGNPAAASETVTYTYDAQGRLIETAHSGSGPNANLDIQYRYDLPGNRTTQTVSGSKNNGQQVVVLPLNGFTIVPINP